MKLEVPEGSNDALLWAVAITVVCMGLVALFLPNTPRCRK